MQTTPGDFRVVCLGGSAGGVEAYIEILSNLPAESGMALVVAPHRGVENPDLLLSVLARATAMPVIEVEQGMFVKPNWVFVMPPGHDMTVNGGDQFFLGPQTKPRGWPITLNILLLSLAKAYGPRAVAVILSGLDHDGSAALKTIKAARGVTFAQSNPVFADMPRSAVETGHVDFILPPAEIAKGLLALPHVNLRAEG